MRRGAIGILVGLLLALGTCSCGGFASHGNTREEDAGSFAASRSKATVKAPVRRGVEPTVVVPQGPPPTQLVVEDLRRGAGPEARIGHKVTVQFVALHWNGEPLQSSWDGGKVDPFTFRLHNDPREVIPGWERGIPGMKQGGRRELIVPPALIYRPGQHRPTPTLGPENTLVYVVELLKAH